jgi:hypothetical protein
VAGTAAHVDAAEPATPLEIFSNALLLKKTVPCANTATVTRVAAVVMSSFFIQFILGIFIVGSGLFLSLVFVLGFIY